MTPNTPNSHSTPPPVPKKTPVQESPTVTPGVNPQPPAPKGKDSNKTWLIIGCVIAALLLIAAALLYFLTDVFSGDKQDYDDGNSHTQVLHERDDDKSATLQESPIAPAEDTLETAPMPTASALQGWGTNGQSPFSVTMRIDPDGNVSGTYWNVIYNLEFDITGQRMSDNALVLNLRQVKDGTTTTLNMYSSNGYHYEGTWGSSCQPVVLELESSPQYLAQPPVTAIYHIKGPDGASIINTDIYIAENTPDDGRDYMWYPDQGYQNRMLLDYEGEGEYVIRTRHGASSGRIYFEDGYGRMTDNRGQTFELTRK